MSLLNLNDKQQLPQDDEQKEKEEENQQVNQQIVNTDQGREGVDYENIYNPKIEESNQEQAEIEINLEEEQDDKQYPFVCLSEVVKMPRNIKKNKKIVFDVTDTIYKVIKNQGSVTMGWTTITSPPQNREEWNICWYDTYISEEVLRRMLPYQKVNHFPGSYNLGKKNYLAANLTRMRKVLENEYSFFPKTWTLPVQFEDFKRYNENIKTKKPYYIVKPESSCQGRGIYLTKKVENFSYNDHCVIQEYIKNPFLIDGLKFDFRIYVLIKNINPLKIFMYPEGLARFATVKYQKPNKKNCQNFTMHLTNYAVNKKNPNFIFNENDQNDDVGHKRSFSSVLKQLHNMGKDIPKLYMEIRQLIVKTVISVQPQLSHIYRSSQPKEYQNEMCFEVLGFDVMIDKELKPWLLEVNHSASFHCDSPLDFSIKKNVILDTLNILNVSSKEKKKYLDIKSQVQFAYRKKDQKPTAETENNKIDQEKIIKYENKHKGAFIRIYPAEDDPTDYDKLLKTASNLWNETVSPKKVNPAVASQNHHNTQSSSSAQKNTDTKNTKSTPFKKPVSQDSHSILNSTQVSQAKSEQKTKAPNSTKKNLSQVFDDQKDKTQESFLNFLPNLSKAGDNLNTGGTTLRQKQGAQFLENNPISIIPSLSQVYLRNDTNKQIESQVLLNNFDDENGQFSNEKDQQEDILSSLVGKKRSMTQIESHTKITQDSSKQYLIHNQSFQYPLTQQHSSNKLNQSPHLQDQYKASVLGNVVGKGLVFQDNPNLVQIAQQQSQISQNNSNQNPTYQYSRNNHFNQKNLDNLNEDAIQLKHNKFNNFNLDQVQNSGLQYNPFQAMQQPQSLENQRKLNIVNLGMNSPEQIINESWYSQTQKPVYLRNSTRKPYKAQLKPLSQDLQNMMQRENRNNIGNKISNITNDSLIQAGTQPKYLGQRKNNIAANIIQKYPHYSHQQNIENQKQQIDYTAAEQIIQRTKNNSVPSKNYRQELYQPSYLTNQNNNINVSPFQINLQNNQQQNNQINNNNIFSNINNNNNNNGNTNTLNTQISFNYNNNNTSNYPNGKNIVQQEVQMSYSKRRILKKSIDRKHVKDMIMNESIAGNYKADQFSKQSIKSDQFVIPSYTQIRNKTTDSIDNFTNQNNYSYNIESQTIGGLNRGNQNQVAQINTQSNTPILQVISPQGKNIDQQNIVALKNQEQPLIITSNINNYQGNQQNKSASNNFNNVLLYGNAQQTNSNNINEIKIYQKNQFIAQQNKLLQLKK